MTSLIIMFFVFPTLIYACVDRNCMNCRPQIHNTTIFEFCTECEVNFIANQQGQCEVRLAKLLSFVIIGAFLMAGTLIIRWIIIRLNYPKKRIYTAEYQQDVFRFMTMNKQVQPLALRAFVPITPIKPIKPIKPVLSTTERGLMDEEINHAKQQFTCDICKKEIQFVNKRVDTFSKCNHRYHAMCLRLHATQFFVNNKDELRYKCPQCRKRTVFLSVYCQQCMIYHRDFEIKMKEDLNQILAFTCFRCKTIINDAKKTKESQSCSGLGRCFYCYPCKDFIRQL